MSKRTPNQISQIYSESIFNLAGTDRHHRKVICPIPDHTHHNYTPSFSIYWVRDRWRWCCHGNCNKRGDVIDLIGYMQVPGYDPLNSEKLFHAISMLTGKNFTPTAPEPPKKKSGDKLSPTGWKDFFPPGPQVRGYAQMRGFSETTLNKFQIGQQNFNNGIVWMTIPIFEDNRLLGIKMRNTNPNSHKRYHSVGGSKAGLFNYNHVNLTSDRVYVVKGEIAALVLLDRGLLACAPSGGESMRLGERYQQALALADCVVIADNDPDPNIQAVTRKFAKRRAKSLNAKLLFPPKDYKDVDEWILADPGAIHELKNL